ncbi:hypothetical protein [Sphingobium sp. CR28]|uniref:hypothetical protein n=1 Tax=Sphingobium sp. CR28 TaxID=3400272 RepID=UPI003FEECD23
MGAKADALILDDTVEDLEPVVGYLAARELVFKAFHAGFAGDDAPSMKDKTITACWRAGATAAQLNEEASKARSFPELSAAPFDTDSARTAFNRALGNASQP